MAMMILLTATAGTILAAPVPLSAEGRALLCASATDGEPGLSEKIARLLVREQPGSASDIRNLTAAIAATGECPALPPRAEPVPQVSALKGQLEFGLGQATGTTDTANANIAARLGEDKGTWSQALRVTFDYQHIERIAANERYTAAYDIRHALSKSAFVAGVASFEHDPLAGFTRRTTQSIGFGAKIALAPTLALDLTGGPSRRATDWLGPRGSEAQLGARGTAAVSWKIADNIDFAASTSGIFEAASGTIEGQASITGKLIGPLATRIQLTARHETRAMPGIEPTSTTSRASIIYDF